ncbi:capping complex subunit for YIEGIA [Brassicibacter mesophilus]|jgi:putative subunit of YIEGIA capping complex|uniref:capping complex subunit for YIEGIA n=1 Tax=Brassicibacter mesophilus TaxID=745119 RepID=UPI003D19AA11
MDVGIKETIIAIITSDERSVSGGSVPTFYVKDENEKNKVSLLISKATTGMIHDLENGCFIIVRH